MAASEGMKKLTLNDLISKKMQRESDKVAYKDIYVKSLDGELTFKKANNEDILDTMDKMGGGSTRECVDAFRFLIYQSCEMLHNTQLHKEYEVINPFDIVDRLFDLGDILNLGNELFELSGLDKIDNTIKN